jgi:hypothetical protein
MGKPKKKIFLYKDGEFLKECDSMHSASKMTRDTMGCIDNILKKSPHWSKRGYFYSYTELRPDQLPDYTEPKIRIIPRDFEDEDIDEDRKCFIPAKKKKAKADLRNFVHARLKQHWMEIPACVARMERSYLEQLLDSI